MDTKHTSNFESLRHITEQGNEFWYARDLQPILGYVKWERFKAVIEKAMLSCEQSGKPSNDHFLKVGKMVQIGSATEREIEDYELSRYACYLIVQNGDPKKSAIAYGQTYFAVQTRKQELQEQANFKNLTEDQKRLFLRNELSRHN